MADWGNAGTTDWNGGGGFEPAPVGGNSFDTPADGFGGGFGDDTGENNNNVAEGGGADGGCFNCGETGYVESLPYTYCPHETDKKTLSHNKAECPNPRVFSGECRVCKKEGHMSKDCPDAGPQRCGNCRRVGHFIDECPDPLVCPRCTGSHKVRDCPEPMKCRHCEGEHMAKDCPTYVPTCKNCGEEGQYYFCAINPMLSLTMT